MRIGIDIRLANPGGPGQQRYLWRLGHWLGAHGHDVTFLSAQPQQGDAAFGAGTRFQSLTGLGADAVRQRVRALELDTLLLNPERARAYSGIRANVLRTAYGTDHYRQKLRSFQSAPARAVRRALRAAPWERAERRRERAFYEAPGVGPDIIAQSRYIRDEIIDTYRVPDARVHVIHNAIDTAQFTPARRAGLRREARARWGIPDDELCLLFLGHNYRLKGLWQVLDSLAATASAIPRVRLLAVGRGTGAVQRFEARTRIRMHGLTDRVTIVGAAPSPLEAYAAADALVHLTWHDSFGFVVLEAMACGLPVVTTRFAGASELLEDGASGLLVDPGAPGTLVDAIRTLSDRERREQIGVAASAVARRHDEPQNFEQVLRVLETARARGAGPVR